MPYGEDTIEILRILRHSPALVFNIRFHFYLYSDFTGIIEVQVQLYYPAPPRLFLIMKKIVLSFDFNVITFSWNTNNEKLYCVVSIWLLTVLLTILTEICCSQAVSRPVPALLIKMSILLNCLIVSSKAAEKYYQCHFYKSLLYGNMKLPSNCL